MKRAFTLAAITLTSAFAVAQTPPPDLPKRGPADQRSVVANDPQQPKALMPDRPAVRGLLEQAQPDGRSAVPMNPAPLRSSIADAGRSAFPDAFARSVERTMLAPSSPAPAARDRSLAGPMQGDKSNTPAERANLSDFAPGTKSSGRAELPAQTPIPLDRLSPSTR